MHVTVVEVVRFERRVGRSGASDVIEWLKAHGTPKVAYTVIVGEDEMADGLAAALRAAGCTDGRPVTVVVEE